MVQSTLTRVSADGSRICSIRHLPSAPVLDCCGHLRHGDVGGDPELVRFNSLIMVAQSVTRTDHLGPSDVGKGDAGLVAEGLGSFADDL